MGYFDVPAALAVLPPDALGAYMLCLLGFAIYENIVGCDMMARSGAGMRDVLGRVLRLPAAHAVALGFAANWAGASGGAELHALWEAYHIETCSSGLKTGCVSLSGATKHAAAG